MKIYFTGSTANLKRDGWKYDKIVEVLESLGVDFQDSWLVEKLLGTKSNLTSQEILYKNLQLLQESDFALVELSTPSFGVGYFIGQAIANKKKIYCLYPDTVGKEEISEIVSGSTSSLLSHSAYNKENLEKLIRNYIANFKIDSIKKFNFIANDEIVKYIEKGARKEKKSKSEFLRDKIIKELIRKK